jgi:hypothetical protein
MLLTKTATRDFRRLPSDWPHSDHAAWGFDTGGELSRPFDGIESCASRFVDAQGDQWAILVAPKNPGRLAPRRRLAIGGVTSPDLLSRPVRAKTLETIDRRLAELNHPAVLCTNAIDRDRTWLVRWRHRLRLLDLALLMLPRLWHVATRNQSLHVTVGLSALAAAEWGLPEDHGWPAGWDSLIFEAIATLCGLQVQILEVFPTGWRPRSILRRPAITRLSQENEGLIRVRFSRSFLTFLDQWKDHSTGAAPFTVRNAAIASLPLNRLGPAHERK